MLPISCGHKGDPEQHMSEENCKNLKYWVLNNLVLYLDISFAPLASRDSLFEKKFAEKYPKPSQDKYLYEI